MLVVCFYCACSAKHKSDCEKQASQPIFMKIGCNRKNRLQNQLQQPILKLQIVTTKNHGHLQRQSSSSKVAEESNSTSQQQANFEKGHASPQQCLHAPTNDKPTPTRSSCTVIFSLTHTWNFCESSAQSPCITSYFSSALLSLFSLIFLVLLLLAKGQSSMLLIVNYFCSSNTKCNPAQ